MFMVGIIVVVMWWGRNEVWRMLVMDVGLFFGE
jgi:hypothetical protein